MAALEYRVLSEILRTKNYRMVLTSGLKKDHFKDPEARQIFDFISNHYNSRDTPRQVPLVESIKKRWPSFEMTAASKDDRGAGLSLIKELKFTALSTDMDSLAREFTELVADNPEEALKIMRNNLAHITYSFESRGGFGMREIVDGVKEQYEGAKSGSIYGIPWPWDPLTADTLGKNPGDLIIFYGRGKSMKCICEGQRIMLPDGSVEAIEDLPEQTVVPSYTSETGQVRFAKARRVVSGRKKSVEVTTRSGLRLRSGDKHLYMVPGGGYARICDLKPGDYVATARRLPEWEPDLRLSPEDGHMLGLLVGDGNYTRNEVQYTTIDPELLSILRSHIGRYGCKIHRACKTRSYEYRIVGAEGWGSNGVLHLIKELGIHGQKSAKKRVPKLIFKSHRETIAAFIAGLFDTDGTVASKVASIASASRKLLEDVQHLLSRFGIRGLIQEVTTNYDTTAYHLTIYSKEQAKLLWKHVGSYMCLPYKRTALYRLANKRVNEKRNSDSIPYTDKLFSQIVAAKAASGAEWPRSRTGRKILSIGRIFSKETNCISRSQLNKLADAFNSVELKKEANTDIIWERIESIKDLGWLPCYDICIDDGLDPNFVVEGFVVHNTWTVLKCAVDDFAIHKRRVLIWSREMGPVKMQLRLGSILAGIDYQCLKKGDLPRGLYKSAISALEQLERMMSKSKADLMRGAELGTAELIVLSGRDAPRTLSEFKAAIEMYAPDVVYVDSFYHMESDRVRGNMQHWQKIMLLAEDLKDAALDFNIPFILAGQANREGEKMAGENMTDMAGADALTREADLVIRVVRKRGLDLYEEDYEGVWEAEDKARSNGASRIAARAGRPSIDLFRGKGPTRSAIPSKAQPEKSMRRPRICAELALMPSGNREGTLEGFIIRATPGYDWRVLRENVSPAEVKEWLGEGKARGRGKKVRVNDELDSYRDTAKGLRSSITE